MTLILKNCIVHKSRASPSDFDEEAPKTESVSSNATLNLTFTKNMKLGIMMEGQRKAYASRPISDLGPRG